MGLIDFVKREIATYGKRGLNVVALKRVTLPLENAFHRCLQVPEDPVFDRLQGLLIKDHIRWQDSWSVQFGKRLKIQDSSDNLFIFDDECTREEIISVIGKGAQDLY